MTRLIVIVTVGIAIVVIATVVVLYLNPAITGMLGGQEGEQQGIIIDEEMISGSNGHQQVNVTVNGLVLVTDISVTNEQRTKGLSEKDDLAENEAMLFVFGNEAKHTFWMKDMKFPIDIIWIDSDKTIIQEPQLRRRDRRGPGLLRGAPRARHLAGWAARRADRGRRHGVPRWW